MKRGSGGDDCLISNAYTYKMLCSVVYVSFPKSHYSNVRSPLKKPSWPPHLQLPPPRSLSIIFLALGTIIYYIVFNLSTCWCSVFCHQNGSYTVCLVYCSVPSIQKGAWHTADIHECTISANPHQSPWGTENRGNGGWGRGRNLPETTWLGSYISRQSLHSTQKFPWRSHSQNVFLSKWFAHIPVVIN